MTDHLDVTDVDEVRTVIMKYTTQSVNKNVNTLWLCSVCQRTNNKNSSNMFHAIIEQVCMAVSFKLLLFVLEPIVDLSLFIIYIDLLTCTCVYISNLLLKQTCYLMTTYISDQHHICGDCVACFKISNNI